jgi:acetyl/propionyl-CoA carboxylase alpha subunit
MPTEAYRIGPPAPRDSYLIGAMGDKVTARKTVERAGVPIVPGTELDLRNEELIGGAL